MNKILNKRASLSSDLAFYLISHPEVLDKYSDLKFITYEVGQNKLNKNSNFIVSKYIENNKPFVRAIRKKTENNLWIFEPFYTHHFSI
jgi:hypothetical protein